MNASFPALSALPDTFSAILHAPFTQNLGWALLHFVWQGALIACVTGVLLALLRNARPQTRYALACASLALCLALPLARILSFDVAHPSLTPVSAALGNWMAADTAPNLSDNSSAAPAFAWTVLTPWVVTLWALGMSFFSLRMLLGLLWLRRLQQHPAALHSELAAAHAQWQHKLSRMAQGFGLTRTVSLRLVQELDSPVTAGWWRPVVFVPAALLTGMPPDFLEALLAHELAHVKRFDYVINLMQSAIETVLFYHPAVWWISKQIRIEREQIADDLAATRLGDTRRLALALQQLDLFQSSINQFAPAANGGVLMSRIKRLIRPEARNLNWKVALPVVGLALVCSALYSNVNADPSKAAQARSVAPLAPLATLPPPAVPAVPAAPKMKVPEPHAAHEPPEPPEPPELPEASASNKHGVHRVAPPKVRMPRVSAPVLAPPAPPEPPIPPAPHLSAHGKGLKYGIVTKAGKVINHGGNAEQQAQARKLQAELGKDVLWFQKDGKGYVVTEPELVGNVITARAPADKLDQEMEALGQQLTQESKKLATVTVKISDGEHTAANKVLQAAIADLSKKMSAIGSKQGEIGAEMGKLGAQLAQADSDAAREQLKQQMAQLKQQMEPLHKEMREMRTDLKAESRRLAESVVPMTKLGQEIREKAGPIRELGQQMGKLGRERAKVEQELARALNETIEKSLLTGAAKSL